ncbi:MAG: glycoside hydrolase family 99-like domain-containing protein [Chloroflexota bacterium]|nr:glycoside hydrolase family 99-like domain-containing protein [Chloroflexota bacterium]
MRNGIPRHVLAALAAVSLVTACATPSPAPTTSSPAARAPRATTEPAPSPPATSVSPEGCGHERGATTARARTGAYYFDGWSGPLTSTLFQGLVGGPYRSREPLYGWQDDDPGTLETQLAWAHCAALDFFVFDWYHDPGRQGQSYALLNTALHLYQRSKDHHGVGFALMFVDNGPRWQVSPRDWSAIVAHWVEAYFKRPDYVRVDGKPLLVILDAQWMLRTFGGPAGVNAALAQLQALARAHGLPGVYVIAGALISPTYSHVKRLFLQGVHYDALTAYDYMYVYRQRPTAPSGPQPYADLVGTAESVWRVVAGHSPVPYVPAVSTGFDARPWGERVDGHTVWFRRSPVDVAGMANDALTWLDTHPRLQAGRPGRPLLFVTAWNELGEGDYIVPTRGDGFGYVDALAGVLAPGHGGTP